MRISDESAHQSSPALFVTPLPRPAHIYAPSALRVRLRPLLSFHPCRLSSRFTEHLQLPLSLFRAPGSSRTAKGAR